ncbi:hypothetical protein [Bacillus toyonensis]|uniref:Uncharacterized protein n=1 Tax=Bacillus toyonensis TaxID=155322 RepID=A0ABX6G3I6_9BACI|nr:hypothetical protein [Bacillus toyonensis]MED2737883.1 hypothetical protein [Bacillus toyonensis]QHA15989.1 hypothetical protein GPA05_02815 [Bacillus toyonensis]
MKKVKEVKAYAISDDFKFKVIHVVISHSKDVAVYWLRDAVGYTNEEMAKFKVWEFPLDKKVLVRDFGETSAREMIEEVVQSDIFRGFPIVVFEKEVENDYFENWHSHFEIEEPTD